MWRAGLGPTVQADMEKRRAGPRREGGVYGRTALSVNRNEPATPAALPGACGQKPWIAHEQEPDARDRRGLERRPHRLPERGEDFLWATGSQLRVDPRSQEQRHRRSRLDRQAQDQAPEVVRL